MGYISYVCKEAIAGSAMVGNDAGLKMSNDKYPFKMVNIAKHIPTGSCCDTF